MPLNRHFRMAVGSVIIAEMTQMQRLAPVMPPRAYGCVVAAGASEDAAENAKTKDSTQRRKDF